MQKFDEFPSLTFLDIKEKPKRYGRTFGKRTDGKTDGRTDNVKTVYPPKTPFCGGRGYKNSVFCDIHVKTVLF